MLCSYTGETDLDGNATGWGRAVNFIRRLNYEGTFLNNEPMGVLKRLDASDGYQYISEFYKGAQHGRTTEYRSGGLINNQLFDNGRYVASKDVTEVPHEAFYSKDARPMTATHGNDKQYCAYNKSNFNFDIN